MARIAAVGEAVRTRGFGLGGALVFEAENPDDVLAAWNTLPADVVAVILTPAAAAALGSRRTLEGSPFTVVMPS